MIPIPNPYPGTFLVFDGVDGCGKSKQLEMANMWIGGLRFSQKELAVKIVKEPGKDRFFGARIYHDLYTPGGLHNTDPLGFQTWYASDSKENLRKHILPALRTGGVVLADRYRSSMVFGVNQPGDLEKLMMMHGMIIGEDFIWPDAIFIFDVSTETSIARSRLKGRELDGHENETVLKRVRQNYRLFAETLPNCHIIDGEREPEQIASDVRNIIVSALLSKASY